MSATTGDASRDRPRIAELEEVSGPSIATDCCSLIHDPRDDLGVNDEGVSVVLHLIDQMHGLRHSMQVLLEEMHDGKQTNR